jgi:hypothetical protein
LWHPDWRDAGSSDRRTLETLSTPITITIDPSVDFVDLVFSFFVKFICSEPSRVKISRTIGVKISRTIGIWTQELQLNAKP